MQNLFDDLQVAGDRITQLVRGLGRQQFGDGLPVARPDCGHDVSVAEIPLTGHVDRAHKLVGHARHRRDDDQPALLRQRGNDLRDQPKTRCVG